MTTWIRLIALLCLLALVIAAISRHVIGRAAAHQERTPDRSGRSM